MTCHRIPNNMPKIPGFSSKSALPEPDIDEDEAKATVHDLPKVLTYDEIDRFLLSIDDLEDLFAARIMLFGGLRVSEVCSLLVKDIMIEPRSVFVRQGKGRKDRYSPLDVASISLTMAFAASKRLGKDDALIKSSVRTIQRHIVDHYQKADIGWGATTHTLRHTCATWQLDKGIPLEVVRENLGHEDIATTQIYLHLNIRQRSRTYRDAVRFGI